MRKSAGRYHDGYITYEDGIEKGEAAMNWRTERRRDGWSWLSQDDFKKFRPQHDPDSVEDETAFARVVISELDQALIFRGRHTVLEADRFEMTYQYCVILEHGGGGMALRPSPEYLKGFNTVFEMAGQSPNDVMCRLYANYTKALVWVVNEVADEGNHDFFS